MSRMDFADVMFAVPVFQHESAMMYPAVENVILTNLRLRVEQDHRSDRAMWMLAHRLV